MALIDLQGVWKQYSGQDAPAVKDISLTLEKGEIMALLGPSGCGKTTTLRLIAGFETVDQGTITFDKRVISSTKNFVPIEKRGIGMVFQDYALFPHLTVAQNITFGLKKSSYPVNKRLNELLELVGLEAYAHRYPYQLSGGQQQRVALARALAPEPVVLLMDEPFSNLDTELKYEMREEIRKIVKTAQATTLIVTHDPKDAFAVADKLAVMNQGIIEQVGPPGEVFHNPASRFVANFLVKANLIPVVVDNGILDTPFGKLTAALEGKQEGPGWMALRRDQIEITESGEFSGIIKASNFEGELTEVKIKLPNHIEDLMCYQPSAHRSIVPGQEVRFNLKDFIIIHN